MTNYYLLSLEYACRPTRSFELYSTGVGICIRVHIYIYIYMYRVTNHTVKYPRYVTLRVQRTHKKNLKKKRNNLSIKIPLLLASSKLFFL